MNPQLSLDAIIAQKFGELTILNAKQAVLIETLKLEIQKRDAELARLKAAQPELPMTAPTTPANGEANGRTH